MVDVVDGRADDGAVGTVSRRRVTERFKRQARRAIYDSIKEGNITDIGEDGVDVVVRRDDLREPRFRHDKGGTTRHVHPGNKEFNAGDRLPKPPGGSGGAGKGQASNTGEGEDSFTFHLSKEEFLDLLFEDLGLPNMRRLNLQQSSETQPKFGGFAREGPKNRLDRKRSKRVKMGRMIAAESPYNREIRDKLKEMFNILSAHDPAPQPLVKPVPGYDNFLPLGVECKLLRERVDGLKEAFWDAVRPEEQDRILRLEEEIGPLDEKKQLIPAFNPHTDQKIRTYPRQPIPENKSVMFCVMDVSGSMDEERKTNAKIFYWLLFNFLKRNYRSVDVVFIRHHTIANEVDEEEFFYGKESGGTIVSSALEKVNEIHQERYRGKNVDVYMAQASDGDNWNDDTAKCKPLLENIIGFSRGVFYTEITPEDPQGLWRMYENVRSQHPDRFWIGQVKERADIWPLFRKFFSKHYELGGSRSPARAALEPA